MKENKYLIKQAQEAYNDGNYETSILLYQKAIEQYPKLAKILQFNLDFIDKKNSYALLKSKLDKKIIVSLTSYPARINTVHITIDSLLKQTFKADKIILWLAKEQFPRLEKDLPNNLLQQTKKGLNIKWCQDLKSFKKLIPALQQYPNSIIVTADDDLIYDNSWLYKLVNAHLQNPNDIVCHRAHQIEFDKQGNFKPYNRWKKSITNKDNSSFLLLSTGGAGTLYPPNSLHYNVLNIEQMLQLCPTAEDLWFWAMAVLNHTKIKIVENALNSLKYVDGTQEIGLWDTINKFGANDIQLNNLKKQFPNLISILKDEKNHNNDKNSIKISIIVPAYNVENYIDKCLLSIRNQTLKDIEIIVVNDGSTDNTANIIEQHAKRDDRIIYIQNNIPSGNPGTPRNQAIQIAKGEYIGFVDSDDWIESNMMEELYKKTNIDKYDIVVSGGYFEEHKDGTTKLIRTYNENLINKKDLLSLFTLTIKPPLIWNKIWNKEFILKNNITFPNTKTSVDVVFTFNAFFMSKKIGFITDNFYHYIIEREGSTVSNRRKGRTAFEILKANMKIYEYVLDNHILHIALPFLVKRIIIGYNYTKQFINENLLSAWDIEHTNQLKKIIVARKYYNSIISSEILTSSEISTLNRLYKI